MTLLYAEFTANLSESCIGVLLCAYYSLHCCNVHYFTCLLAKFGAQSSNFARIGMKRYSNCLMIGMIFDGNL